MARVDFYILQTSGELARQQFACRLAEKAYKLDNRIHIHVSEPEAAARLDDLLWTFRGGSFVPHELLGNTPGMADRIDIIVPDLGEYPEAEIIEVLVSAGGTVHREDVLITLKTDKATMDVPAPAHGSIVKITVAVGRTVSSGDVIGSMTVEEAPDAVVQMPTGTKPVPEPESASASPVVT
ncbi:MAG: DNA polymerase III subunit chi, partial [Pseudomonadota bacterium]|nr:DNA polymerase III subunit chi [Pseudomonadota bacterium]